MCNCTVKFGRRDDVQAKHEHVNGSEEDCESPKTARTLELTRLTSLQNLTEWTEHIVLRKPNRRELLDLQLTNL